MSKKYALIIGNTDYGDPGLAQLRAPGKDVEDFARVLTDKGICAFDEVSVLLNQPSVSVIESIDDFFDNKKSDDLLVLYFSGHGLRDEIGSLYLAFQNTLRSRLRSTAIKSDYIREAMDQSRSKRQVVILDCCNSGAFPQGTKAEIGGPMGMAIALQGYGRFVLTASDATQFAWEGERLIGEAQNSLFTHFLIKGLEGEADENGDGRITVDDLYDYAYKNIAKITPKQTPTKSTSRQEGEFVLRDNMRLEDIKPIPLPDELLIEIDDTRPYVREAALQKLEKIIQGKNIGMARSAMEALEKIASDENSTRRIANAATTTLDAYRAKFEVQPEISGNEKQNETNYQPTGNDSGTTGTSTEKMPANDGAQQAARRKPMLTWGILGVVGCCIVGASASGLYSIMNGFAPATSTPTQKATLTSAPTSTPTTKPTSTPTIALTSTPEPTFTATAVPVFLPVFDTFQDNFDNNENDWNTGETSSDNYVGQRKLENGMYVIESTETKKTFVEGAGWASAEVLQDFNVSTHVRLLDGNPSDVCYGLRFRETTAKGFYLFLVCDSKFFRIRHYNYQTSQWTNLRDWTKSNSIKTGEWNNLAIQATGSSLTFYVNQTRVAQLVDEKETEGKLLLVLDIQNTVPGSVGFDDLSIQKVFYDGFNNNDNSWQVEPVDSDYYAGGAKLEDGIYTIESSATKKTFLASWGLSSQEEAGDFNVSVKAKLLSGDSADACYGIRYRYNDHGNYVFEVCDNKKYLISHYDKQSGTWTTLQGWTPSEEIKPGGWNTLAVTAVGDTFTFYINGKEVTKLSDQKEIQGKIHLVLTLHDTVPGAVGYDDFVLVPAK